MASLLLRNLGGLITGDLADPFRGASTLYADDGVVREIDGPTADADTVVDARGLLAVPGLIDTHVHPTFGDFTPTQSSVGWMSAYLHGAVTSMVSAGELHLPGLPLDRPQPRLFRYLSVLARRCADNLPRHLPRLHAGTLLLTPGLAEPDFDEVAEDGVGCAKFIFYPYGEDASEERAYVRWCRERGIVVKIHTGGVSRSGLSRPAGARVVKDVQPDVAGHISGGPIPMPREEMEEVVNETGCYLEVATGGSVRRTVELLDMVHRKGAHNRVVLGTDTPSGTGVTPRGMLRNVALVASLGGVTPEAALCMATGNAARAHRLDTGLLHEGKPADLVLIGRIAGAHGRDALEGLSVGDIPGVAAVIVGGRLVVRDRSQQTPPPEVLAVVQKGA